MAERSEVRVLIADDHPMFRLGLAMALRSLGFNHVDEAVDGQHAVDLNRGRSYDVVLLDLRMPRLNGVEAARRIVASGGDRPPVVVMLSTFDEPAVISAAREAGVRAVLGKETEPAELAMRIDRFVAEPGGSEMDPTPPVPTLSIREEQVLRRLVAGASTKDIATDLDISIETVKDHLGRLYAKMDARDRISVVAAARRLGWILLDELSADSDAGS